MENILAPTEHEMLDDTSVLRVTGDALADAVGDDVVLERRILVGQGPIGDIAVSSADKDLAVVVNVADQSVSIFKPAARPVGENVAITGEPFAVIATNGHAYVATGSDGHDAVSKIDLETAAVVATFPLALGVTALAASPDGNRVYAGWAANDRVGVTVIDTVDGSVEGIDIGCGPAVSLDALRVDPGGKRLYVAVTDVSGSRLVIVDDETSQVQRVVGVGSPIRDIAQAGDTVYVLTSDRAVGGTVHVIDLLTNRVTGSVITGGAPTQLVVGPDQARAYIVDYDRVVVLCALSLEILDSLPFEARPSCVALGKGGSHLYVADYSGVVHKYSVESTIEKLYSHFLATDPIALSVPRARVVQAAAV